MTVERLHTGEFDRYLQDYMDPAIVWDMSHLDGWLDAPVYEGHDGVRRVFESWLAPYERVEYRVEYVAHPGDREIVAFHHRGYLPDSPTAVQMRYVHLNTLGPDGKLTRVDIYSDVGEAFAAAGAEPPRADHHSGNAPARRSVGQ
jgi:ketosteroid isomerase-like protein